MGKTADRRLGFHLPKESLRLISSFWTERPGHSFAGSTALANESQIVVTRKQVGRLGLGKSERRRRVRACAQGSDLGGGWGMWARRLQVYENWSLFRGLQLAEVPECRFYQKFSSEECSTFRSMIINMVRDGHRSALKRVF
eukprot:1184871-Prorocentrum_minimum.AAC.2